ncbi:TPA: TcdA/TcdB pore-forming domain-containing protein [Providencia rettgeri]
MLNVISEYRDTYHDLHLYFFTKIKKKLLNINEYNLIIQAINDNKLKSGIISGVRLKNRAASLDIKSFKSHPSKFVVKNAISLDSITNKVKTSSIVDIQFVKTGSYSYELEFVTNASKKDTSMMVEAFFLGYNETNFSNKSPAYIDIPKNPSKEKFLFTGTLSGCSVIVTELNETTYRVYHDERVNSSILYDNVLMAVDYKDYQIKDADVGIGTAYMQYENGIWQLVLQKQKYEIIGGIPKIHLRDDKSSLLVQFPLIREQDKTLNNFKIERDIKHRELIEAAKELGVNTENIYDIEYKKEKFSLYNMETRTWAKLVQEIKEVIDFKINYYLVEVKKINLELIEINSKPEYQIDKYKKLKNDVFLLETKCDYLKVKYNKLLSDILILEKNWLWLEIKNREGSGSVIGHNYDKSVELGKGEEFDTLIEQRFKFLLMDDVNRDNSYFFYGYNNYSKISFPMTLKELSSLELKKIYLNCELTIEQRGALSRYIEIEFEKEYVALILIKGEKIKEFFHSSGCDDIRLIPQDFYLLSVKDNSGGRCYPLVRAMAVALAKEGKTGSDNLIDKLFYAMSLPDEENSKRLKTSLIALHSNVLASQASTSNGILSLVEIQHKLSESDTTRMYSINTTRHAMLLGKTVNSEEVMYYFYDPNFGIFGFNDEVKLFNGLKEYMLKKKMASFYNAMGNEKEPKFELITIDIDKMADVPIGSGLTVDDLHNANKLNDISERRAKVSLLTEQKNAVAYDLQLQASLQVIDAKQWVERIDDAVKRLADENYLDNKWLINFSNIKKLEGGNYLIQFFHQEKTIEPRWIETSDSTFLEFSHYFDQQIDKVKNYNTLIKDKLVRESSIDDIEAADGLNMGIEIHTLIQWANSKHRSSVEGAESNLGTALKIHSYVGFTMMAHGAVNDMSKVNNIIKSLWQGGKNTLKSSMNTFTSSVARSANEGIGLIFNGTLVGLDIYELTQSETESQQTIFRTQLAFDSTSLTLGIASISAGAAGATGVAAFCGGGGVIVGGLAIGFTSLAANFSTIAEDAKAVGKYFYLLDKAYQGNGFDYIPDSEFLVARQGGVIERIDFKDNCMVFGSQYIYRSGVHEEGGGYKNYFFWPSYANVVNHDKEQSLNIREEIGYLENTHYVDYNKAKAIILPNTPKSYISYEHSMLPGSTSRGDLGFNILRRIEKSKKFDFDYYTFPSEYIISSINQEYVKTNIDIILDDKERHAIIPKLPKEWHGLFDYKIKGCGGDYQIYLTEGVEITLSSHEVNNKKSNWIINANLLESNDVIFYSDKIKVGGVTINIMSPDDIGTIMIVDKKNEISSLDLEHKIVSVINEDANYWTKNQESVDEHLSILAKKHRLYEKYITVDNYQHNGIDIGRAFYDVEKSKIFYIESGYASGAKAVLSLVADGLAYIVLPEESIVFILDIDSNRTLVMYCFDDYFGEKIQDVKVLKINNYIYMSCILKNNGHEIKSMYQYNNNTLFLVSVSTEGKILSYFDEEKIDIFKNGIDENKILSLLHPKMALNYDAKGKRLKNKDIKLSDTIMFSGEIKDNEKVRFWLRTKDSVVIRANIKKDISYKLIDKKDRGIFNSDVYDDLIYINSQYNDEGKEVFYFYNSSDNTVYWQIGLPLDLLDDNGPIAQAIDLKNVINVINWEGNCIAITKDGGIYYISTAGLASLIAVNNLWFKKYNAWFNELIARVSNDTTISILGLVDGNNDCSLYAWYINEGLFVSTEFPLSKRLTFLGYDNSNELIFIFDRDNGELYSLKKINATIVNQAFSNEGILISPELINSPNQLYSEFKIKDVKISGENLILKTSSDDVIVHVIGSSASEDSFDEKKSVFIKSGSYSNDFLVTYKSSGIRKIIFNGEEGHDTYIISESMWEESEIIIIDNNAIDRKRDDLVLIIKDLNQVLVDRNKDDLVFIDVKHQTKLIFRQVFGSQAKQHQHLNIILPNKEESVELDKLIERYNEHGPLMALPTYYSNENVTTSTLIESISFIGADKNIGIVGGFKKRELSSTVNNLFSRGMEIY